MKMESSSPKNMHTIINDHVLAEYFKSAGIPKSIFKHF